MYIMKSYGVIIEQSDPVPDKGSFYVMRSRDLSISQSDFENTNRAKQSLDPPGQNLFYQKS